jgi:hypothetical protein
MINKLKEYLRKLKIKRADYILSEMPERVQRKNYYCEIWIFSRRYTKKVRRAWRLMNYYSRGEQ